jgi:aldehyde:ferredoxin oxidoreductase
VGVPLGAYYVLNYVKPGTDAFDPENVIVFGGSVVTGARIAGFTRHSVTSISPLIGGISDSEAGGFWARELKAAGFDAVVVQGCSPKLVYLWLNNGKAEIKDATHIWGRVTGDAQDIIRKENNDESINIWNTERQASKLVEQDLSLVSRMKLPHCQRKIGRQVILKVAETFLVTQCKRKYSLVTKAALLVRSFVRKQ